MGNASTIDGKKYFSGHATQRQGNQTLVSLKGLDENLHAVTLQLDPDKNDLTKNIGMQVKTDKKAKIKIPKTVKTNSRKKKIQKKD